LAAQIEEALHEQADIIQSSGGVFEVEDNGVLIFSKKRENRFPEEGEVLTIVAALEQGKSLEDAQALGRENAPKPPNFAEWFFEKFGQSSS
jgi:selT/selW/selH-like putative selenoprotein